MRLLLTTNKKKINVMKTEMNKNQNYFQTNKRAFHLLFKQNLLLYITGGKVILQFLR
jgi:hypothetical protein